MNLGNMWRAAGVGSIFDQNNAMEESGFDSDELTAGRVLWSDGIDRISKLLDELMSGDAVLNRDNLSEGVAKTMLIDGVKQIDLSKIKEGDIGLMLGVILSHEAMRDGVEGTEQEQAIETFRSVLTHSIVAGMVQGIYGKGSLRADVIADIKALQSGDMDAFARYALGRFDGSSDFWKLIENDDGSLTLHDDGRGGVFYDGEDGEEHEMGHFTGGSRTDHLRNIFGLTPGDAEKARLNTEVLVGLGSAEILKDSRFVDTDGNPISIDLTGEWSDRMGAALDYDRMFVDSWRSDGNMNSMINQLGLLNVAESFDVDLTDRQNYLADMLPKALDFTGRFAEGNATEHLFSQTEIENAAGFGYEALCYATVPVNLYQLKDPSISLDMIGGALRNANNEDYIRDDGLVNEYDKYIKSLGDEFKSSQYLTTGLDFDNLNDYLTSDYSMADIRYTGTKPNGSSREHHKLYRNDFTIIDPSPSPLEWGSRTDDRYRSLYWMNY